MISRGLMLTGHSSTQALQLVQALMAACPDAQLQQHPPQRLCVFVRPVALAQLRKRAAVRPVKRVATPSSSEHGLGKRGLSDTSFSQKYKRADSVAYSPATVVQQL